MFENLSGGQFLRITDSPLVRVPDVSINGASADYDNDGDLDVCVTSWNSTNQLYRNVGNGVFELDPASPPFPSGQRRNVASWGDYDNDGWLDERERRKGWGEGLFVLLLGLWGRSVAARSAIAPYLCEGHSGQGADQRLDSCLRPRAGPVIFWPCRNSASFSWGHPTWPAPVSGL